MTNLCFFFFYFPLFPDSSLVAHFIFMLKKEHPYSKAIKNTYCTYFNKNVLYELGIILSFLLLLIKHIFFSKGGGVLV